jgi:hypothetical protein
MYIIETVDFKGNFDGGIIVNTWYNAWFYYNRQKKNNPRAELIQLREFNSKNVLAQFGSRVAA